MGRVKTGTRTKAQQSQASTQHQTFRANILNYLTTSAPLRDQIDEDFRFNRGGPDQWKPTDRARLEKENRPCESFNAVGPVVNFLAGYQWERRKDLRYFPRGTEDEQIGRLSTALAKYAMDAGQGDLQQHRHFRKGAIGGHSALYLCLNYNYTDDLVEGELDFDVLPENSFGYSPYARRYDRNDSDFFYMMYWEPIDKAQKQWKQHEGILTPGYAGDWLTSGNANTGIPEQLLSTFYNRETAQVRIIRYFYRKPVDAILLANHATQEYDRMGSEKEAEAKLQRLYDTAGSQVASTFKIITASSQSALVSPDGQMQMFVSPDEAQQALDQITKQAGAAATKDFEIVTRPTTTMRMSHNCAWEQLDDQPSPYGRLDDATGELIPDWHCPFNYFIPYQDTDDFLSIKGIVRDIKDPQRNINWYLSTAQDKLVRGPKGVWLIQKGEHTDVRKVEERLARAGVVFEYAAAKPEFTSPPPIAQEDMAMVQGMLEAIMRITGVNAELLGQTTQKTISGRSIQARQSGGLVGVSSLLMNWASTQQAFGELLIRRIQQYYSVAKMNRIIGDDQRMQTAVGLFGPQQVKQDPKVIYDQLKRIKDIDFDCVVEFQDHAPTARQAVVAQMMQFMAAGMPIPPDIIIEASDVPRKSEIQAALKKQGMQPPNPELAKALSAGQGQTGPTGVNKT